MFATNVNKVSYWPTSEPACVLLAQHFRPSATIVFPVMLAIAYHVKLQTCVPLVLVYSPLIIISAYPAILLIVYLAIWTIIVHHVKLHSLWAQQATNVSAVILLTASNAPSTTYVSLVAMVYQSVVQELLVLTVPQLLGAQYVQLTTYVQSVFLAIL